VKNLAIAFCSFRPEQYRKELYRHREEEYSICLAQLARVLPQSYDLVVVNNTEQPQDEHLLQICRVLDFIEISDNQGTKNKGVGELDMLEKTLKILPSKGINISEYEHITWTTGRKIFTCPYVFERTENLQALISNPDFLYLDGRLEETEKNNLYNDMIFSMKTSVMLDYSKYSVSRLEFMVANSIGSEQNLYSFIKDNNISYEWLDFLGILRNDWERNGELLSVRNFQVV
jgi:hypothetical protein